MPTDSYATETLVKVIRVFEKYVGPKPPHINTAKWVDDCMRFLERKVERLETRLSEREEE